MFIAETNDIDVPNYFSSFSSWPEIRSRPLWTPTRRVRVSEEQTEFTTRTLSGPVLEPLQRESGLPRTPPSPAPLETTTVRRPVSFLTTLVWGTLSRGIVCLPMKTRFLCKFGRLYFAKKYYLQFLLIRSLQLTVPEFLKLSWFLLNVTVSKNNSNDTYIPEKMTSLLTALRLISRHRRQLLRRHTSAPKFWWWIEYSAHGTGPRKCREAFPTSRKACCWGSGH